MNVIHLVPGSGGTFYCQNCLRDAALVQALRRQGIDALIAPMYLPLFTDGPAPERQAPLFFGGVNVWLQQHVKLFRSTPRCIDRLLDSGGLLRLAAARSGSVSAANLGPMTLSMLEGRGGHQHKEIERLVQWLSESGKPDVVHLSNLLLIGLAGSIKDALDVPVVCTLQDEDWWLDDMRPPYDERCRKAIRERIDHVDRFAAVSDWFSGRMRDELQIPSERIETIHVGIDPEGYGPAPLDFNPPVLGFLSRMNPAFGLEHLVDAFIELKRRPGLQNLRLRATGGAVGHDRRFVTRLKNKLKRAGVLADADFPDAFHRAARQDFLRTLSVLCVPAQRGEAFGTYLIEAMASGVPVVQPRLGAFPELIEATGGGLVYEQLLPTLETLLADPPLARRLAHQGRTAVLEQFTVDAMAAKMIRIYETARTDPGRNPAAPSPGGAS